MFSVLGASIQDGPEAFEVLMDRANMAGSAKKRNLTVKRPPNSKQLCS